MTQPSFSRAPVALAVFGLAAAASLALPLSAAAADKALYLRTKTHLYKLE